MISLKESVNASWMKGGSEGYITKDEPSQRQFTLDVGDGKERSGSGEELRKYTFESLNLSKPSMGSIIHLNRKLYEDGEEVFTLEIFVIPDEKDVPDAKTTGVFVTYDQQGNKHTPDFKFGIGGPERIPEYANAGYYRISDCPEKINFEKTVDRFKQQARKSEFHNPQLFKARR